MAKIPLVQEKTMCFNDERKIEKFISEKTVYVTESCTKLSGNRVDSLYTCSLQDTEFIS